MRKIYLILIALVTLSSLQSCEKSEKDKDLGPIDIFLLINKHSDLYKDLEKAFDKNDYVGNNTKERKGFNNVYFLKGEKRHEIFLGFKHDSSISKEPKELLYKRLKISEDYAYLTIEQTMFKYDLITNKEELFLLKYDNKEVSLKIKGAFGNSRSFAKVEHFYVNDKKMKHLVSDFTQNVVLFLTE